MKPLSPLIRRLLLAALILALIVGAVLWLLRPKPIAVILKTVEAGKVESTVANTRAGTVEACQRTKLSTIMGGRIEYLGVKEGDKVKKGQLLMKLWNDDQKAQETLAKAGQNLSEQRVNEACIAAANAEREADRQTTLRKQGFVSVGKEELTRTEARTRRAACNTAKADVMQAQARVGATQTEQGRIVLIAPFDGTIAKIVGELGEYSTPSPPGVLTPPAIDLIDESCLYVKAPMDEVDAPKIEIGQKVRITLDALPKKSFPGKVKRVAPYVSAVEKQARTVDIEVNFDAPESAGRLLVGYSADVEVMLASRDHVLRVPTAAIQEGGRVLVYNPKTEKLDERKIKTGLANWENSEVLEGLTAGERIATSLDREGVKVGARVVADEKAAAK